MDTSLSSKAIPDSDTLLQTFPRVTGNRELNGWLERYSVVKRQNPPDTETKEKVTSGLTEWQRKKIIRFVDENIGTRLRVIDLSEHVRLSASRFSKGFRVTFGRPPYDYVLSRRMEATKYLIASRDEPLSQIAHACGLSDQAHLSKVFKRLVGTTPLRWRKNSSMPKARQWGYLTVGAR